MERGDRGAEDRLECAGAESCEPGPGATADTRIAHRWGRVTGGRFSVLFDAVGHEIRSRSIVELAGEFDGVPVGFAGVVDLELVAVEVQILREGDVVPIDLAVGDVRCSARRGNGSGQLREFLI